MIRDVTVNEALLLNEVLLVDVRSENEYSEATIPGAVNIPIFNNEERVAVGTVYHEKGSNAARRHGLALIAPKLPEKIGVLDQFAFGRKVTVFCWRGGERSRFMSSVFDAMGYSVYRVVGGYKAYRRYVNNYLNQEVLTQKAIVLHGLTGVGKTDVLVRLGEKGIPVLDLEGLAKHRGSVYGKIGMPPTPSQKAFESYIVQFLTSIGTDSVFLVECESRRLGKLLVPLPLANSIKRGTRVLLYAPLEKRVKRICETYTVGPGENINELQEATFLLAKRIGEAKVKELNQLLAGKHFNPVFSYLLKNYYDPLYQYPDGPSKEYELSVDTSDVEKAVDVIYNFINGQSFNCS